MEFLSWIVYLLPKMCTFPIGKKLQQCELCKTVLPFRPLGAGLGRTWLGSLLDSVRVFIKETLSSSSPVAIAAFVSLTSSNKSSVL